MAPDIWIFSSEEKAYSTSYYNNSTALDKRINTKPAKFQLIQFCVYVSFSSKDAKSILTSKSDLNKNIEINNLVKI